MNTILLQAASTGFDFQSFIFGEDPWTFIFEVMVRSAIMFIVALASIRAVGQHGIKQRLFEIVIIIALGSAAGDAMFYKDVGLAPAIMVFIMIVFMYRLTHFLVTRRRWFDKLVQGSPLCLIKNGEFDFKIYNKLSKTYDEFLPDLRTKGTTHLGQIKYAILEDSGEMSVVFYSNDEVKPGLPIMPWHYDQRRKEIRKEGSYACIYCGHVVKLHIGPEHHCQVCNKDEWLLASDEKRIT